MFGWIKSHIRRFHPAPPQLPPLPLIPEEEWMAEKMQLSTNRLLACASLTVTLIQHVKSLGITSIQELEDQLPDLHVTEKDREALSMALVELKQMWRKEYAQQRKTKS